MPNAVVFVGGVSGTEKSTIVEETCKRSDGRFVHLKISEFYKAVLSPLIHDSEDFTEVEWKEHENDAIELLSRTLHKLTEEGCEAIVINTHFASPSVRGFLPGTDPTGLATICSSTRLLTDGAKSRAGVVLVDSTPAVVLAASAKHKGRRTTSVIRNELNQLRDIEDDLTQNRSKSMDYYHCLVGFLGYRRVNYFTLRPGSGPTGNGAAEPLKASDIRQAISSLEGLIKDMVAQGSESA